MASFFDGNTATCTKEYNMNTIHTTMVAINQIHEAFSKKDQWFVRRDDDHGTVIITNAGIFVSGVVSDLVMDEALDAACI